MYALLASNTARPWFVRLDSMRLRWTDEAGRARIFDTPHLAHEWLKRREHSGLGVTVQWVGVEH